MVTVSLLLPTRGRSDSAVRFIRSARDHATHPAQVEVVLFVDDDDEHSKRIACDGIRVVLIVGSAQSMGGYNTACLRQSVGDIVMLANDDIIIRTPGWDEAIRAVHRSVSDKVYLAYPNDLFKGERVCTFPILSRSTCDHLRDPFPRQYKGSFIDYHLLDIFKRLEQRGVRRIFYLEKVVFEHMHYRLGKSLFDDTYRRRNRFGDDSVFLWLASERRKAAANLLRTITGAVGQQAPGRFEPLTPPRASILCASLLDTGLPVHWRLRLFIWFLARKVASRLPVMPPGR